MALTNGTEAETEVIVGFDEDVVMQGAVEETWEYNDGETILGLAYTGVFTEFFENTLETLGEICDGMVRGKFGSVLETVSDLLI